MKHNLKVIVPFIMLTAFAGPLMSVGVASAATTVTVPTQTPDPAPYGSSASYPILWTGGVGTGAFVSLSGSGLPVGAFFEDSSDGCVPEDVSGSAFFPGAAVVAGTAAPG
jgi:hypothetical protein